MAEPTVPKKPVKPKPPAAGEPGLFDYLGTFPVWVLKLIQLITPSALIEKSPPSDKTKA